MARPNRHWFRTLISEPLVHFLLVGGLLFAVFNALGNENEVDTSRRIHVDTGGLLTFFQSRSKTFNPDSFADEFERLPAADLQRRIDDFVRDEALYREARALRLDEKDFGVRQRLIRQLEFINQGVVASSVSLSENDLRAFLDQNPERYEKPAAVTFTHVFLNSEHRESDKAEAKAKELLRLLNGVDSGSPVAFHKAPGHGDRVLFRQNYVNQEADEVKSHFGEQMQQEVFDLQPDSAKWRGPFQSPYGFHLVMLTKKADKYLPGYEELKQKLEIDAYQARLDDELRQLENSVIETYDVVLDPDLQQRLSPEAR